MEEVMILLDLKDVTQSLFIIGWIKDGAVAMF